MIKPEYEEALKYILYNKATNIQLANIIYYNENPYEYFSDEIEEYLSSHKNDSDSIFDLDFSEYQSNVLNTQKF